MYWLTDSSFTLKTHSEIEQSCVNPATFVSWSWAWLGSAVQWGTCTCTCTCIIITCTTWQYYRDSYEISMRCSLFNLDSIKPKQILNSSIIVRHLFLENISYQISFNCIQLVLENITVLSNYPVQIMQLYNYCTPNQSDSSNVMWSL